MNVSQLLLAVVADDLGIGPATTEGILDVAVAGRLTATVLLVNTPYAEDALRQWARRGRPVEIGWHPNLTLDKPLLPTREVPTLVGPDGRFHPRGRLLRRVLTGRVAAAEARREFAAQLGRFQELVGHAPRVVNAHQHLHVFPVIGRALRDVLAELPARPWLRRLGEPMRALLGRREARIKRLALHAFGRWAAWRNAAPGPDCLLGVTDPPSATREDFYAGWIRQARGGVAELMCHPGRRDETLLGRDCVVEDGWLEQRVAERALLLAPGFPEAVRAAGRRIARVEELLENAHGIRHAA